MSKKIFVVEDDAAYAGELRTALEQAGFAVQAFETANAAMTGAEKSLPDAVVTGAMLEDLGSGFRLAQWIKDRSAAIPVVIVTGIDELTGLDFAARAAKGELVADTYMKKPVAASAVAGQIQNLLA